MRTHTWWKRWGVFVGRLIAHLASFASMASLALMFMPPRNEWPGWVLLLILVAVVSVVIVLVMEFRDCSKRRTFATSDAEGIRDYMHEWITHAGRVAIWTRDMSWAQNRETRKLLVEKARHGELIVCLPELGDFAKELDAAGAEICAYGAQRLESPSSRFTISSFGRVGARVAVGRVEGDTHIIEEFQSGSDPAFHLAEDLVALARALQPEPTS